MSYERAVSMHTAAREMVYVAEQGLMADGKNTLDPTWQEMLNHATAKVTNKRRDTVCERMALNDTGPGLSGPCKVSSGVSNGRIQFRTTNKKQVCLKSVEQ